MVIDFTISISEHRKSLCCYYKKKMVLNSFTYYNVLDYFNFKSILVSTGLALLPILSITFNLFMQSGTNELLQGILGFFYNYPLLTRYRLFYYFV